ncbi:MAG: YeiH family protein, partial [Acidimicrobiales bacterium]
ADIGADVGAGHVPVRPTAPPPAPGEGSPAGGLAALVPGLVPVVVVTAVATALGGLAPVVGAPVIAIVAGIVIAALRPPGERMQPGLAFASRKVLQGSIIVLGLGLSLGQVLTTGARSLPVLAGTLVVALVGARVVGHALHLRSDVTTLIGVGTAICGASAIAATDAVIDAGEADVSYAVATIFTFNVVAVLAFPTLGHYLGLSSRSFGLWAGTAINDVSSVVAASTVYGHAAVSYAVVVKLVRTLAIVPICLALAAWHGRRPAATDPGAGPGPDGPTAGPPPGEAARGERRSLRRIFPLFILGFVAAVVADTLGAVPSGWHHGLSDVATWMITAALAAIGLSTRLGHLRRTGPRPMLLGAVLWLAVGVVSLALQAATGTL